MRIEMAKRIDQIPPYLFAEIDKKKEEMRKKGMDLIDLGIGDPDLPTPKPIIERLKKAAENPKNHRYPSYEGMIEFRTAVAQWYERRFGVKLDPGTEVLSLIGSKEGIAHIPLAFVNPGDYRPGPYSWLSCLSCLDPFCWRHALFFAASQREWISAEPV